MRANSFQPILVLAIVSAAFTPARAEHPLAKRYLDGLFRAKPHLATFMGDHRFDGVLPDLSPDGLKRREDELAALEKDLKASKAASLDDEIDAAILSDGIALELLYLREIRDWEWDPRLYDSFPYYDPREIVAGRLSDIVHGTYAPEDERLRSVLGQLKALPVYLGQVEAALVASKRKPSKEYAAQAVKGNKGRIELFETELKEFTAKSVEAEAARRLATEALKRYQNFLETKLTPGANGDWRLGAQLFAKKFPLALQTTGTPESVAKRAEKALAEARQELLGVAMALHKQVWPGEPISESGLKLDRSATSKLINRVKDEISKDHARPDALVEAHGSNLDSLRSFIEQHNLLSLPPRETLTVEPMPAFKRGSTAAEYLAPGVLDRNPIWKATYYVDPIDPTWPAERVESYLRGQNSYEVQLVAAHEAYPGHHTQYFYSKRNLNPLRAVLWNAAMVEGWAVYGEGLMVRLGWGGEKNLRFRFYDLRGKLIVCANTILDIRLQSGQMSDEEAVSFMVDQTFQEQAMAEKKLLRAKLDSTQLSQYFLGLDEIEALERDDRRRTPEKWSQRTFNEALIGHGSIAVKFLRRYLLGE